MVMTASPAKSRRPAQSRVPSRYDAFILGQLSVEDLDMEELLKGQIRDKNGSFRGRPPRAIPREFHVKVVQELLQRADGMWIGHMEEALNTFVDVMNNPRVAPQWRLQAAQYVYERIAGKIPDKQIIQASVKKWEDVAEAVMVEITADDTIDAEIVPEPKAGGTSTQFGVVWDEDETSSNAYGKSPAELEAASAPAPKAKPRRPTRKRSS